MIFMGSSEFQCLQRKFFQQLRRFKTDLIGPPSRENFYELSGQTKSFRFWEFYLLDVGPGIKGF